MALVYLYRLSCEGVYLAQRLGRPAPAVEFLRVKCKGRQRGIYETARHARRDAKREGWTRRAVELPINITATSAGTTVIRFDLCPNCTELIPS